VASYVEEPDRIKMTQEEYRQLAVGLQEKKDQLDMVEDEQQRAEVALQQQDQEEQGMGQEVMLVPVAMTQAISVSASPNGMSLASASPAASLAPAQSGGLLPPGGPSMPTYVEAPPGGGPMIAVDTNPDAFERDGILLGGGRAPRRNSFRAFGGSPPAPMASPMPVFGESQQVMPNVAVRVNKME
jgi:hypothetical protein